MGVLGAGTHDVPLAHGSWLPPGLHLVRLTRGPEQVTARVTILR